MVWLRMRYFILSPDKTHKRFRVTCYRTEDAKRVTVPLTDSMRKDVLSINEQMLKGVVSAFEAKTLLNELIDTQYRKLEVKDMVIRRSNLSEANQHAFKAFWQAHYATKHLQDDKSPRYDLQAALRLIEPYSIQVATQVELQAALAKSCSNVKQVVRASNRINQILTYLNRDFRLSKPKPGLTKIRHVNLPQFLALHAKLVGPAKDLAMVLFAAGLRIGEAIALEPTDFFKGTIHVAKQLPRDGKLRAPKRGKVGRVQVLKVGHAACVRWCAVADKVPVRQDLVTQLRRLGKITPHDLRHSHAIHWLSKGASLKLVANNLRNRQDVCEMYYAGYEHTDDTLEGLKRLDSDSDAD